MVLYLLYHWYSTCFIKHQYLIHFRFHYHLFNVLTFSFFIVLQESIFDFKISRVTLYFLVSLALIIMLKFSLKVDNLLLKVFNFYGFNQADVFCYRLIDFTLHIVTIFCWSQNFCKIFMITFFNTILTFLLIFLNMIFVLSIFFVKQPNFSDWDF